MNDANPTPTSQPALKKYSCADVDAELADKIAPRARLRRVSSGVYLSRLLREAFAREDEVALADPRELRVIDSLASFASAPPSSYPSYPSDFPHPMPLPPESPLDAAIRRAAEVAAKPLSKGMRDYLNRRIRNELELMKKNQEKL